MRRRAMAERRSATLEQRVAVLEGELRRANERIRAFEYWRRRATRQWTLIFSGVVSLLLVLGWVAPTPGAGPASAKAPFRVVNGAGTTILEVLAGKQGGWWKLIATPGALGWRSAWGRAGAAPSLWSGPLVARAAFRIKSSWRASLTAGLSWSFSRACPRPWNSPGPAMPTKTHIL